MSNPVPSNSILSSHVQRRGSELHVTFSFCANKVLGSCLQPKSHEWEETGREGVSVRMILAVGEASSSHSYTHDQSARLCHLTHLGGWTTYQNAAQTVLLEDVQGSPAPGLEHLSATALPVLQRTIDFYTALLQRKTQLVQWSPN